MSVTKRDGELIALIVDRAVALAREFRVRPGRVNLFIGIAMAHQRLPLNLDMLLAIDDANFAHDVFGIMRHIDPRTGHLLDCFVPRTARLQHTGVK
jgi:hypothetical protein